MRGRGLALLPKLLVGIAEEPTAVVLHGGVCEGGGSVRSIDSPLLGTRCSLPIRGMEHGVRELKLAIYLACVAF
jgi:hypothetical protein